MNANTQRTPDASSRTMRTGGQQREAPHREVRHQSAKRLTVKSAIKAGGQRGQHDAKRLTVKSAIKAGGRTTQHNARRLTVKSAIKAGQKQHNAKRLTVKSAIKAGTFRTQHNTKRVIALSSASHRAVLALTVTP